MSSSEHLTQMANDIAHFFSAQGTREDAIAGIANHLNSYWTRRMRETLIAHTGHGEGGLEELPRAALERIIHEPGAQPNQPAGGDAG
jgi:formate dehydrogenase subunit delta